MQPTQHDDCMPGEVVLAVSLELAGASWKIALHDGKRDKPAIYP
jgi:transposase